jgi:hypothetical protein
LPANGKKVGSLPEKISINRPAYTFTAAYTVTPGKLLYKNEIILNSTELKPENFLSGIKILNN